MDELPQFDGGFKKPGKGGGIADLHVTGIGPGIFDDEWMGVLPGFSRIPEHIESGHHREAAVDIGLDALWVTAAAPAVLGVNGGNPGIAGSGHGSPIQCRRGAPDQWQAHGACHLPLGIQSRGIVDQAVATQWVNVHRPTAAVQIDVKVRIGNHIVQGGGDLLGGASLQITGESSGEIFAILPAAAVPINCGLVGNRDQGERATQICDVNLAEKVVNRENTFKFIPMDAGGDQQMGTLGGTRDGGTG